MDRTLVERARAGDREAFAQIATQVSDRLYAIALRMLRDADAASDALQTALVSIWRQLPDLRDPERFEGWAYRILIRSCQADRRRARRSVVTVELQPSDAGIGDSQLSVAVRDEIDRAFQRLTHDQRAILVLSYYRDLPIAEVAEILGIAPGTAKSRLHYARQAMRAAIVADARPTAREGRST